MLVATGRELDTLRSGAVELDALVRSGEDESEAYHPGDLDPEPKLVVTTSGSLGGWMQPGGPYTASPPPGEIVDAFGAGDSFMAGLTFALGAGQGCSRRGRLRGPVRGGRAHGTWGGAASRSSSR